ncbi:MAG TPA: FAD:protein FMN transferase [bacterium]|nr:FAD:protein FMN transferase [bacterium]
MWSIAVPASAMVRRLAFRAMGSEMALITVTDHPDADVRLNAARAMIDRLEERLSRFRASSELSTLNAQPGRPVRVSEELWDVLIHAMDGSRRTNGLYDPTIVGALERAGYDRPFEAVRGGGDAVPPGGPRVSWRDVGLDCGARRVTLPVGVRLDFGGIGKAWTADRAAGALSAAGPCLVDAGGDIAVRGVPAGWRGWPVGITDPRQPAETLTVLAVTGGGVATSGVDVRRWRRGGQMCHHIIDPRTGMPAATDLLSVTVVGPDAMEANLYAVTTMILGSEEGLRYLAGQHGVEALAVRQDGGLRCTPGFPAHVWSEPRTGGRIDA